MLLDYAAIATPFASTSATPLERKVALASARASLDILETSSHA
jgi:hypothetical protein